MDAWMIDFGSLLRYFRKVLGRGADPISSGGVLFRSASEAHAKGASAVDPPKSPRQLNAGRLGARAKTCPLSSVVKFRGWSAIEE